MAMTIEQLIREIIAYQSEIIGSKLATHLAMKSTGIQISNEAFVLPEKTPKDLIKDLIFGYAQLFGQSSVEVCLEVIFKHEPNDVAMFVPDTYKNRLQVK